MVINLCHKQALQQLTGAKLYVPVATLSTNNKQSHYIN